MIHATLTTWNMDQKRVFVRADLNVPLDRNGNILSDFKLKSIVPTLDYIINHHGAIILATHIGQPKDYQADLSTTHLVPWFAKQGYTILFVPDISSLPAHPIIPQQIILLENLRFFPGEKNGDPFFAKQLAHGSHYYVNDAFGVVHHSDCSVTLLPHEFPLNRRSIGFLMEKELQELDVLRNNPKHPFLVILGGGKIADKIPLMYGLLKTADTILICPALCFTFLKSLGQSVGKSLVDDNARDMCTTIINEAHDQGVNIIFPLDYQIATGTLDGPLAIINADIAHAINIAHLKSSSCARSELVEEYPRALEDTLQQVQGEREKTKILSGESNDLYYHFPHNAIGISIGPKTVELFNNEINQAQTIFFNCAMGFDSRQETRQSTYALITAMAHSDAHTVIAGGDSVDAAFKSGSAAATAIDHLSTGGGAALAYLSGKLLPGLAAFEED